MDNMKGNYYLKKCSTSIFRKNFYIEEKKGLLFH